jgi:hypothetical protein
MSRSGVCLTAQRTIRKSPTIGIFSRNISQMNVQVVTLADRIPGRASVQAPDVAIAKGCYGPEQAAQARS